MGQTSDPTPEEIAAWGCAFEAGAIPPTKRLDHAMLDAALSKDDAESEWWPPAKVRALVEKMREEHEATRSILKVYADREKAEQCMECGHRADWHDDNQAVKGKPLCSPRDGSACSCRYQSPIDFDEVKALREVADHARVLVSDIAACGHEHQICQLLASDADELRSALALLEEA